MPARALRSENLAAPGNLETFRNRFAGFAASNWLRHKAQKIDAVITLTTGFRFCVECWALSVRRLLRDYRVWSARPVQNRT